MNPEDSEIRSHFDQMNVDDIKNWLLLGTSAYFENGESYYWGFSDLSIFFRQSESLLYNIKLIFDRLTQEQRLRFQLSIVKLVVELPPEVANYAILRECMLAATLVGARQIVSILPSKVGGGAFGRISEISFDLYALAIDVALAFAVQTDESYNCIKALAGYPNFDVAHAGLVLIGLCRSSPYQFYDHMSFLRAPLSSMFKEYSVGRSERVALARKIVAAVGVATLAKQLCKLDLTDGSLDKPTDRWFLEAAVVGDDSPAMIRNRRLSLRAEGAADFEIEGWRTAAEARKTMPDPRTERPPSIKRLPSPRGEAKQPSPLRRAGNEFRNFLGPNFLAGYLEYERVGARL